MSVFDWQLGQSIPHDAPDGLYMDAARWFVFVNLSGYVFQRRSHGPTKADLKKLAKEIGMSAFMLRHDARRSFPYRWERVA